MVELILYILLFRRSRSFCPLPNNKLASKWVPRVGLYLYFVQFVRRRPFSKFQHNLSLFSIFRKFKHGWVRFVDACVHLTNSLVDGMLLVSLGWTFMIYEDRDHMKALTKLHENTPSVNYSAIGRIRSFIYWVLFLLIASYP